MSNFHLNLIKLNPISVINKSTLQDQSELIINILVLNLYSQIKVKSDDYQDLTLNKSKVIMAKMVHALEKKHLKL